MEKGVKISVKSSADARQKAAIGEGHEFHPGRIDAEGGGGQFVVFDTLPKEPVPGKDKVSGHEDKKNHGEEGDFQIDDLGMPINPRDPPSTSVTCPVVEEHPHQDAETKVAMARKSSLSRRSGRRQRNPDRRGCTS